MDQLRIEHEGGRAGPRTPLAGFWQPPSTLDAADPSIPNLPLESPGAGGGITGTGALVAQSATLAGVGISASRGTGSLVAQAAALTGVGKSASRGIGSLAAQAAVLAGIGKSASRGTGSLVSQTATIAGTGLVSGGGGGPVSHNVGFLTNLGRLGIR